MIELQRNGAASRPGETTSRRNAERGMKPTTMKMTVKVKGARKVQRAMKRGDRLGKCKAKKGNSDKGKQKGKPQPDTRLREHHADPAALHDQPLL